MMPSFTPKDIESLSKLSSILIIPFIAAAVYVDFGLWVIDSARELGILASSRILILSYIAKVIAFSISVVVVAFIVESIRPFLYRWPVVVFFTGMSFLTFGVLGLGHFAQCGEKYSINFFWHLGFLAWGFEIFIDKKS
jgi:hypothetical protein